MSNPKGQYSIQLVQSPWEMYDNLDEVTLKVSTEHKQYYDHNRVWYPKQLQTCSFRFDFQNCDLENLYENLLSRGIISELLITVEDNSTWSSYTQSYDIKNIVSNPHQIVDYKPKMHISAHDGLVIRLRLIVKHLSMKRDKALQKYSVLSEKVFLLHVDTHASDFAVRLVEHVNDRMGFKVIFNSNSSPFEQPIHECITIEFMSKAYQHYQQICQTSAGKALSKMILGHILSEIVCCLIPMVNEPPDGFDINVEALEQPMMAKLCILLQYKTFQEFQRDCKENPERIIQRARTVVNIEQSLVAI